MNDEWHGYDDEARRHDVAFWVVVGLLLLAIAVSIGALFMSRAYAHDAAAMVDAKRGAWFESLKQPGTGTSCCNLTDCEQTQAKQLPDGSWQAVLNDYNGPRWVDVPPEKVVQRPLSVDGEAYLCHSVGSAGGKAYDPSVRQSYTTPPYGAAIYCFVPPIPGF